MARSTAGVTHILTAPRVLLSVLFIRSIRPLPSTLWAQLLESSRVWLQLQLQKYKYIELSLKNDNHLLALSWFPPQKENAQTTRLTLNALLDNLARQSLLSNKHTPRIPLLCCHSINQSLHFREEETEAQEVTDTQPVGGGAGFQLNPSPVPASPPREIIPLNSKVWLPASLPGGPRVSENANKRL